MTEERSKLFDELYIRNYDRLVHIGYRLLGSREQAEELTQETFLLALVRIGDLAAHPCPEGWLTVTLINLIKNERRRYAFQEVPLNDMDLPPWEDREPLDHLLPVDIPKEDRQLLIWRYEEQLSCEEIADRLGISHTACRSRISRALARCRAHGKK